MKKEYYTELLRKLLLLKYCPFRSDFLLSQYVVRNFPIPSHRENFAQ